MEIRSLTAGSFRNLSPHPFEFHPRLNLIVGDNGQGKTNLLEALALSFGLSSFRTSDNATLLASGSNEATVISRYALAETDAPSFHVEPEGVAGCAIGPKSRRTYLCGNRVAQLTLRRAIPAVFITASDRDRLAGPPGERRKAIDRIAFALDPTHARHLVDYERARAAKSALLARQGFDPVELEVYERAMCVSGAEVLVRRRSAVLELARELRAQAERLEFPYPDLVLRLESDADPEGDALENLREIFARRGHEERAARRCLFGPHRNDVRVLSGSTPLTARASSGEVRLLLLAWTLAEIAIVARHRGVRPLFAFDDFDAEWDGTVLARFARALPEGLQLFLTSARASWVRGIFSTDGVILEVEKGSLLGRQPMSGPADQVSGPRLVA
ncbi:MAG: AAA family ATPase [Acidobacteria bacterium]|nr:AAA family ATPase [Acidobacteriota bacterium]MCK6681352.1 AAA family ATPase [Thermoanaerobaculia bacterium]